MLDDFLTRAALAGLGVALAAGPLGCFVVWRRMAYLGEAIAHTALLGVALGVAFDFSTSLGALMTAAALAVAVALPSSRSSLAPDTLLGVLAHSALALGLVAMALTPGVRVDLMSYLFGDILAVTPADLALIWAGALGVIALLVWRWRLFLNAALSEPLARAEGHDPARARLLLSLALALAIALAMQVVGLLLVTSLMILPAAAARFLARSPEQMALMAAGIGAGGVLAGLWSSYQLDAPTGPMIVVALAVIVSASALRRA